MNIFNKILQRDFDQTVMLGNPLGYGTGPFHARMNAMSIMTGGRGFQQPKKGPKLSRGGKTRRERREPYREIYHRNLEAERTFREAHAEQPGWGTARTNRAIERRQHLK